MNTLVTGAARGLGYEISKYLLQKGHTVFAGVREESGAKALFDLARVYPDRLFIYELDVRSEQSVQECKRKVLEQTASLDAIINNAAILVGPEDPVSELKLSDLEDTFAVNTLGPVRVVKHFIELIHKSVDPTVLNVSSEAGSLTTCGRSNYSYCMSKAALNMFTHILKKELSYTSRVYAIHPGRMRTDMGKAEFPLHPSETAEAIYRLLTREVSVREDHWFINIYGEAMPL